MIAPNAETRLITRIATVHPETVFRRHEEPRNSKRICEVSVERGNKECTTETPTSERSLTRSRGERGEDRMTS